MVLRPILSVPYIILSLVLNIIFLIAYMILARFNQVKTHYQGNIITFIVWLSLIALLAFSLTFTQSIVIQYFIVFVFIHSFYFIHKKVMIIPNKWLNRVALTGLILTSVLFVVGSIYNGMTYFNNLSYDIKLDTPLKTIHNVDYQLNVFTDGESIYMDGITFDHYDGSFNLIESYDKVDYDYRFINGALYQIRESLDQTGITGEYDIRYDFYIKHEDTFIYQRSAIVDGSAFNYHYLSFFLIEDTLYYYNGTNYNLFKVDSFTHLSERLDPSSLPDGIFYESYHELFMVVEGDFMFKSLYDRSTFFQYHDGYIYHPTSNIETCKVTPSDYNLNHLTCEGDRYRLTNTSGDPYPIGSSITGELFMIHDTLIEYNHGGGDFNTPRIDRLNADIHNDLKRISGVDDLLVLKDSLIVMQRTLNAEDEVTYTYYLVDPSNLLTNELTFQSPYEFAVLSIALFSLMIIPIKTLKKK
jgi:hypothetical protein